MEVSLNNRMEGDKNRVYFPERCKRLKKKDAAQQQPCHLETGHYHGGWHR